MKKFLKTPLLLLVFLIACEQQTEVTTMPEMTKLIVASDQFKALNVKTSHLVLTEAPVVQPTKNGKAVALSYKSVASYKKLIAFFTESNEIRNVVIFEVQSSEKPHMIESALLKWNF